MFTRHLSKSSSLSCCLSLLATAQQYQATLYLQSMALNCVYSKKCSSKNDGGGKLVCVFSSPSSLLHSSLLKKKKSGSLCFSLVSSALHTFLNVRLSPRGFSAVQLFSSQAKCGHLIMFDVFLFFSQSCNHLSASFGQPYLSDSK